MSGLIVNCVRRLRKRLNRTAAGEDPVKEWDHSLQQFEGTVETGFQLATFKGPLCAEPVEGMAYFVESIEYDSQAVAEAESCE